MAYSASSLTSLNLRIEGTATIWQYNAGNDSFATVATAGYFSDEVNNMQTGDKLLVVTDTDGLSFSGTIRSDGTNIFVDWDNTLRFETQMADVSAASTVYFNVPPAGVITQVYGVLWSAVTVASAIVTFSINTTAITTGVLTVTTAGAAGTLFSATPTALNITDGVDDYVKAASDGASTTTAIMTLGYKIICPARI
jgi:hypothetical protein